MDHIMRQYIVTQEDDKSVRAIVANYEESDGQGAYRAVGTKVLTTGDLSTELGDLAARDEQISQLLAENAALTTGNDALKAENESLKQQLYDCRNPPVMGAKTVVQTRLEQEGLWGYSLQVLDKPENADMKTRWYDMSGSINLESQEVKDLAAQTDQVAADAVAPATHPADGKLSAEQVRLELVAFYR